MERTQGWKAEKEGIMGGRGGGECVGGAAEVEEGIKLEELFEDENLIENSPPFPDLFIFDFHF